MEMVRGRAMVDLNLLPLWGLPLGKGVPLGKGPLPSLVGSGCHGDQPRGLGGSAGLKDPTQGQGSPWASRVL